MGTIISRFSEKTKSDDKTTCISITAESYKCIDISAYVPQCIMITSNVPTSEQYEKPRSDVAITDAPILEIILINNEAPVLGVNLDENGTIYVTKDDVVYIKINNYNHSAEYMNMFSNEDGNDAVVWLDRENEQIIWVLDDWAFDDTRMWFYAQAKESDKLISPQSNVTVTYKVKSMFLYAVYQDGNGFHIAINDSTAIIGEVNPLCYGSLSQLPPHDGWENPDRYWFDGFFGNAGSLDDIKNLMYSAYGFDGKVDYPTREWFYSSPCYIAGTITKLTLREIIEGQPLRDYVNGIPLLN